jgi:phospholipase A1
METIILVPGGEGSRLKLQGEEIWPPTVPEMIHGYDRMAKLLDTRVKVGKIFDAIACYGVYEPLQNDLKKIAKHLGAKSVDFPYDWRKDIFDEADKLAAKIASYVKSGSTSITLVGHSMGNLLARMILESGDYATETWFNKITRYIGICGPHFGVPHILTCALGLKGSLGISPADMKIASGDPRYPGCYQCLPFENYQVLFDINDGAKDFYKPAVAQQFGLNQHNLGRAKDLQNKLKLNKPTNVKYVLIAGSDQTTDESVVFDGSTFHAIKTDAAGDSMIPLWSAAVGQFNPYVTPGDHMGILKSYPFKQILYDVLTGGTLVPQLTLTEQLGITLSLNNFVYAPSEPIQVVIIPDLGTQEISGTLLISHAVDQEAKFVLYQRQSVEYRGPQIRAIRFTITAPADPGAYQLTFTGSHGTSQSTAAGFVVNGPSAKRATLKKAI